MLKNIFLTICLLYPAVALAQDEYKPEASITLGYVQTSGNSETKALSLKANHKRKRPTYKITSDLFTIYGESDGDRDTEKIDFKTRFELRRERYFPFFDFKYYRNPFQKYEYRISAGPGIGYYVFKSKKQYLPVSYYLYYNSDKLIDADRKYRSYFVHNVEERFKHRFTKTLSFKEKIVYSLTDRGTGDYYIDFEAGIVNKITKRLGLEVSFIANYQNRPVEASVERLDTTLMTSLVINL